MLWDMVNFCVCLLALPLEKNLSQRDRFFSGRGPSLPEPQARVPFVSLYDPPDPKRVIVTEKNNMLPQLESSVKKTSAIPGYIPLETKTADVPQLAAIFPLGSTSLTGLSLAYTYPVPAESNCVQRPNDGS